MKKCVVAEKFDIKPQTLSDLIKNANKIKANMERRKGQTVNIKRARSISFEDVDSAMIIWFRQYSKDPELRIDSQMLHTKANYFAREFGKETDLTKSWVDRWKKRWGIGRVLKAGESGGVNMETVDEWRETVMKDILERYEPANIYNADETGLFWQLLPENTMGFLGKKQHGSKQPKTRITLLVGANMNGTDKLPMFAIGKSKNPRAFKNVKRLPVKYEANKKAWMRSDIFERWLNELDTKMKSEARKIAMIVDNCPAHPHVELDNIELVFLPPNTTSITQPMDSGVIRNLKLHYRRILASRRLQAAEAGDKDFIWNLLDCLFAVKSAWSMVTPTTVANCFRNAGFVIESQIPSDTAEANTVPESDMRLFRNLWDDLRNVYGELASLDSFIDIDNATDCVETMTDDEIVSVVTEQQQNLDHDDTEEQGETSNNIENNIPTLTEAQQAIDCIRRFSLSMEISSDTDQVLGMATTFEQMLVRERSFRAKQAVITDFFRPKDNN